MVLVVYYNVEWPMRRAVRDHLLAFRRHLDGPVVYVNTARSNLDRAAALSSELREQTSLIVFHTTFLSAIRWDQALFENIINSVRPLAAWPAMKVALPQDEFYNSALLERVFVELGVERVLSSAPSSEWSTIYPGLDDRAVSFRQVLTGYIEESAARRVESLRRRITSRPIAVGYRAWRAEPWLGSLGKLKAEIGEVFRSFDAPDFRVDVSTEQSGVLLGNAWLKFLLRCRATLGSGSGASILDRDGSLRESVRSFIGDKPDATYEEVEQACFPGRDGELRLHVLGPRHLEACTTRTVQVLVRGPYNGILEPDRHYIPLEPDYSNLEHVVERLRSRAECTDIAANAYADIVGTGRWTYRRFVAEHLAPLMVERQSEASRGSLPQRLLARAEEHGIDAILVARHSGPGWIARMLTRMLLPTAAADVRSAARRARGLFRKLIGRPQTDGIQQ